MKVIGLGDATAPNSGTITQKSATSSDVRAKAINRPQLSARQWILDVRPPRERRAARASPQFALTAEQRTFTYGLSRLISSGTSPEAASRSNRRRKG
jgi:hypothetical protein